MFSLWSSIGLVPASAEGGLTGVWAVLLAAVARRRKQVIPGLSL
jgi:hypothetical protein